MVLFHWNLYWKLDLFKLIYFGVTGGEETKEGRAAIDALAEIYENWLSKDKIIKLNTWSSELSKLVSCFLLKIRNWNVNKIDKIQKGLYSCYCYRQPMPFLHNAFPVSMQSVQYVKLQVQMLTRSPSQLVKIQELEVNSWRQVWVSIKHCLNRSQIHNFCNWSFKCFIIFFFGSKNAFLKVWTMILIYGNDISYVFLNFIVGDFPTC